MIDIGANLTNKRFENSLESVVNNALEAGVDNIIITGTDIPNSIQASKLCQQYPMFYSTAGIHPHDASSFNSDTLDSLKLLLENPNVIAVGETGLDFNRNFSTATEQIFAFEQQLNLAIETQLPVFLHERDAFDTQSKILKAVYNQLAGAVVHCFTGNRTQLEAYLELGFSIGITGWVCDERRGQELQSIVSIIPDDKLLIETDAPYLTPRTLKGKQKKAKNEPANLLHIAEQIAILRNQSTAHIKKITTENSKTLFNI